MTAAISIITSLVLIAILFTAAIILLDYLDDIDRGGY